MLTLPNLLRLDAATCAVMAALLLAAAPPLAAATALPDGLLRGAGLVLIPCAVLMAWTAGAPDRRRPWAQVVILGNLAWCAASLVALGLTFPNALGVALVLGQAAAVAALAGLEAAALRRVAAIA